MRALVNKFHVIVLLAALSAVSCGNNNSQRGEASWYGKAFDGRKTASGEIFEMEKLTAAHRTLAFGTIVRVRNIKSQKTVDVKINDRGPFVRDRIIDLSHGAAVAIGITGVALVELTAIRLPKTRGVDQFSVQVAVMADHASAKRLRDELQQEYGSASLVLRDGDTASWRILVGLENTEAGAQQLADKLKGRFIETFVVHADTVE